MEPGRSGVGGEGFDCTERPDKRAEEGGGIGGMGGGGRQEGFTQPSGHLHPLWEPELSHRMGRLDSWRDGTEVGDGGGAATFLLDLRAAKISRVAELLRNHNNFARQHSVVWSSKVGCKGPRAREVYGRFPREVRSDNWGQHL